MVWLIATFVLCTSLLTKYTIQSTLGWLQLDNVINYHVLFPLQNFPDLNWKAPVVSILYANVK